MIEEMVLVPKRVLKMITPQGFIDAFLQAKKSHITQYDAYEICEQMHEKYFGRRKYSEFQVFKAILSRKKNRK